MVLPTEQQLYPTNEYKICCSPMGEGRKKMQRENAIEGLHERTEYLDIFLFSAHHSMAFYFRRSVYWWKGSVRF